VLEYRVLSTGHRSALAHLLRSTRRYSEAEAAYQGVVAGLEALRREHPELTQFRSGLASALVSQGELRRFADRMGPAKQSLERAADLADALAREFPEVSAYRSLCVSALIALAKMAVVENDMAGAGRLLERANPHLRIIQAADPEDETTRNYLLESAMILAQIQARQGDARTAEVTTRRADDLPRSPRDYYNVAVWLSEVMNEVLRSTAPEADRAAAAWALGERAAGHMRAALARGYRNVGRLRSVMGGEPFRSRPDVQALYWDLVLPADPFAR
jgi:hypothetical protein